MNENDHSNKEKDEENVDSKIEEYNESLVICQEAINIFILLKIKN